MALRPLDNEARVLASVAKGDHHAFCALFDHYHRYVFGFGRKLTRSDDQAEEIVQEIFIKVWNAKEQLPQLDNFEAYLTRLVRNQAYSILRKQLLHSRANAALASQHRDVDMSLHHQIDYQETRRILDEALHQLTPQQQRVYQLCRQDGLKYDDAAQEMGISAETVRYHMKMALKSIRNHFGKYGFAYSSLIFHLFS